MLGKVLVLLFALNFIAALPDRSGRILGGRNVLPGEVPWIVSLRFWGTNFHFAGGSLISGFWVVTVAEPIANRAENSTEIVVGTTLLNAGGVRRQSNRIQIHSQFDPITKRNNIACVRSSVIIPFDQFTQAIPLGSRFIESGIEAQIAGWGAVEWNKGDESNFLQAATVTTSECPISDHMTFLPQHLCAGTPANSSNIVGICTTDIGGPLILNNQLIGIAAWHDPNGCGISLDGFLRISTYRIWIMGVTTG